MIPAIGSTDTIASIASARRNRVEGRGEIEQGLDAGARICSTSDTNVEARNQQTSTGQKYQLQDDDDRQKHHKDEILTSMNAIRPNSISNEIRKWTSPASRPTTGRTRAGAHLLHNPDARDSELAALVTPL